MVLSAVDDLGDQGGSDGGQEHESGGDRSEVAAVGGAGPEAGDDDGELTLAHYRLVAALSSDADYDAAVRRVGARLA